MKELIIVRHAKSDWGADFLKDIDRPLNERGYRDTYFLSEWFSEKKSRPDLILSSTATRALSTALIFARALEQPASGFATEKNIYEASVETLLSVIRQQRDTQASVMIFGHNPSLTTLCNQLSDDLYIDNLPTCGIVSYGFSFSRWADLEPGTGHLNYFQFPKNFKNTH
jgi:phosphohistidine phosphatase